MNEIWRLAEVMHVPVYFHPQTRAFYQDLGLRGYWMGYFASRAAPMGPVPAEVVTATFHGFAPEMVAKAIPDAWSRVAPHDLVLARFRLADKALRAALGDRADDAEVRAAADLLDPVLAGLDVAGRPLAAAHLAVRAPTDPLPRLWHAASVLREYRGDCHVAALVVAGIDGCAAQVIQVARGVVPAQQREFRGWTEEQWAGAQDRLRERGWLAGDGKLTDAGEAARAEVEDRTGAACDPALAPLDGDAADRLRAALRPLTATIVESSAIPYPNPAGSRAAG